LAAETVRLLFESSPGTDDGAGKAQEQREPLLGLRPSGTRPPFILLPALGGDIRCYSDLVQQLGDKQPVYAFRPRGADQELPPHRTMDEMIADYLVALRALQPTGPYYLGGWSTGGIFAFALAEALERAGEDVALLAMFDTPVPSICDEVDISDDTKFLCNLLNYASRFSGTNIAISYDELKEFEASERFAIALAEARQKGVIPAETPESFIRQLVEVGKANVQVIQSYSAKGVQAPVVQFVPRNRRGLAEVSGHEVSPDADNGWNNEIGQSVELHEVAGDHFTMMLEGSADVLARELSDRLARHTVANIQPR
jgi:myxalamid-type polyketide synthase MxaB